MPPLGTIKIEKLAAVPAVLQIFMVFKCAEILLLAVYRVLTDVVAADWDSWVVGMLLYNTCKNPATALIATTLFFCVVSRSLADAVISISHLVVPDISYCRCAKSFQHHYLIAQWPANVP